MFVRNLFVLFSCLLATDDATRPTTFTYLTTLLVPAVGTIEVDGSVFLDSTNPALGVGPVEIGDFSIGYDLSRASPTRSGMFVESTVGTQIVLFDIGVLGLNFNNFVATESELRVESELLVSNELADLLGNATAAGTVIGQFSADSTAAPLVPAEPDDDVLRGDVNLDGVVDFFDISPFIASLTSDTFQAEADVNGDGIVDFLDISPFINGLIGQ